MKKQNDSNVCFVSEKKILYIGKEYELIINKSKLLRKDGFCEFCKDKLVVNIPNKYEESERDVYKSAVLQIIRNWYIKEANEKLISKTQHYANLYNFSFKNVCAKEQKTMWGCCDFRNNIRYNWRIIMTNEELMNYLVVHELSHTIHKNHSSNFWKLVESIIPNYKILRKQLRSMGYVLRMI